MPSGLILPYTDTSIPDGWSRFSASDGKAIMGAGTSHNPGDTGGSDTATLSAVTSSTDGAHVGVATGSDNPTTGGAGPHCGNSSAGGHSHDFSANDTIAPAYRQTLLIQADSKLAKLPAKACVLWQNPAADPTGLTQQYLADDDKMFRAAATIGTGGDDQLTVTSTSEGAHTHGTVVVTGSGGQTYNGSIDGAHDHAVDLTVTFNVKEVLLGLWMHATTEVDMAANFIAMYESTTPPTDWVLCDGTGGTPDMRDFFLGIGNKANQGTSQGDNTMSAVTPSHSWNHNHRVINTSGSGAAATWSHTAENHAHTHTVSLTDSHYLPPWYSLAFIMYSPS